MNPWYVRVRGRVSGPYTMEQLRSQRKRGQLSHVHEVSEDGQTWKLAATLGDLFPEYEPHSQTDAGGNGTESTFQASPEPWKSGTSPTLPQQPSWHYSKGSEQRGPVGFAELQQLAAAGVVGPNDLVWQEGTSSWIAAGAVPSLGMMQPTVPSGSAGGTTTRAGDTVAPKRSGLALASLIVGIFGLGLGILCGILPVLAIVLSSMALWDIGRSRGAMEGKYVAMSGLILGIIGAMFWVWYALIFLKILELPQALRWLPN